MNVPMTQVTLSKEETGKAFLTTGQVLVLVPTYNERENIEPLVRSLLALPVPLAVLIIDDNSQDGTGAIADRLAQACDRVHIIHRSGKLGLGSAYLEGFRYGLGRGYDFLMTMDADFSHDPACVPSLIQAMDHADLVIGSRYRDGGTILQWPLSRRLLSRGANTLAKLCLGLQVSDCTAGFRCYRKEVLRSLNLDSIRSNGYSCLVELLFECQSAGWRCAEVPIIFVDRQHGKTKISRREIYKGVWTILRLAVKRWR